MILQIFLIPESSICLTLSLVIAGEKEEPIFCNVSLSHLRPTLLSITFFSLSDRELKIVPKDSIMHVLSRVVVFITIFLFYS
jgi:hypothetical protein